MAGSASYAFAESYIVVIDDFTADTLDSAWNEVYLLSRGQDVGYDTTTNVDQLTLTAVSENAEQRGLLRDDWSLGVGETLKVDMISMSNASVEFNAGIMIHTGTDVGLDDITGASPSNTLQDRLGYIIMSWRSNGSDALCEYFPTQNNGTQLKADTGGEMPMQLWITRDAVDTYSAGWVDSSGSHTLADGVVLSQQPGAAVGFYFDLRADGTVVFDNPGILKLGEPAHTPGPADGAIEQDISEIVLKWSPPSNAEVTGYNLYYTDYEVANDPNSPTYGVPVFVARGDGGQDQYPAEGQAGLTFGYGRKVYWRVDTVYNGLPGEDSDSVTVAGVDWFFETASAPQSNGIVDDFTNDTPDAAWRQVLLLSRNSGTVTYDTTTNDDALTIISGHSNAEQIGWLRDDHSLAVGDVLSVDLISMTDASSGDFTAGLMIATGTDIGIGEFVSGGSSTQEDRRDYVTIGYDSGGNRVLSEFFDGPSGSAVSSSMSLSSVTGFWIERTGDDSFDVGWFNDADEKQLLRSVTFTSGNTPGAAIGFYTDMRDPGGVAVFDDLAINGLTLAITAQPQDATVVYGENAVFSAAAEDTLGGTIDYQWYNAAGVLQDGDYDGRISGADTSLLVISGIVESDQGEYYCQVSNSIMSLTTDVAVLTAVPYLCDENFPSHLDIAGGPDGTGDCVIDLLDVMEFISEWLSGSTL